MNNAEGFHYVRDSGDARYWADARTLRDLGELTARWLEGTIDYQPAWESARPDPETDVLVPVLAALNRSGFVTHFSQPGTSLELERVQLRAAVSGFTTEEVIDRLQGAVLGTELIVFAYPPGGGLSGQQVPIGISYGNACRWAGAEMAAQEVDEYYGKDLHPDAIACLKGAWQVTVIDARWGRNGVLWDRVRAAVLGLRGEITSNREEEPRVPWGGRDIFASSVLGGEPRADAGALPFY
jgi:hypothetical protein